MPKIQSSRITLRLASVCSVYHSDHSSDESSSNHRHSERPFVSHFVPFHVSVHYTKYKDLRLVVSSTPTTSLVRLPLPNPSAFFVALYHAQTPRLPPFSKALISLKTRNGIVFSPHPRTNKSTAWRLCPNHLGYWIRSDSFCRSHG